MNSTLPFLKSCACAAGLLAMMASAAWAGPEAMLNTQTPLTKKGTPLSFGFGGERNQEFMLGGKPFQIRGAEIHPQRIPREYWRHRIQMARAMGLNTIAFYAFWNDFERPDGSFDFKTGNRDIAQFMKMCQEEGMWVLFRPGPYVCGEWDLGGLPHYLLKDPKAKLRTTEDANFMKAQARYLEAIAKEAKPFLIENGGPIIMTQIENEYGSYQRKDRKYLEWLHDFWTKKGFGTFYMSDGAGDHFLKEVVMPGVAIGLDPGVNDGAWAVANKHNPNVPVFSSETYPGWLRHWGEGNWQPTAATVKDVAWFMDKGKSFSLFMFHGGTNFGLTAGANKNGDGAYEPDLTSYDYGAPVDEQGRVTPAYEQMREIILKKLPAEAKVPEVPVAIEAGEIAEFTPVRHAGLWENLPKPLAKSFEKAPYFEQWGQNQGAAIYKTELPAGPAQKLVMENLNDYAQVYLDGKLVGTLDRRLRQNSLELPARTQKATLEVFVEAMGHVNFHINMEADRKGLFGVVKLGEAELKGWKVTPMPLSAARLLKAPKGKQAASSNRAGAHFLAEINLDKPVDTFLDMSKYTKGYVWVNGINIGRYWNIGPQLRLYVPATFLKAGKNRIDIVDLFETEPKPLRGMAERNKEPGKVETKNLNNAW